MLNARTRLASPSGVTDLDDLGEREFGRLRAHGEAYLDCTGSALYGESPLHAQQRLLHEGLSGNPHSQHAPSRASTDAIEEAPTRTSRARWIWWRAFASDGPGAGVCTRREGERPPRGPHGHGVAVGSASHAARRASPASPHAVRVIATSRHHSWCVCSTASAFAATNCAVRPGVAL
jgi:hypothetical protein